MELFPTADRVQGRRRPEVVAVVAAGGAIGASARWLVARGFDTDPATWPWPTLVVNVLGCLLIGIAATAWRRGSLRWDFAITGVLGGFTTMSTFAVELTTLVDGERTGMAVAYGLVTLVACASAVSLTYRAEPS